MSRRRQRGIALITAVILVAIATVMATAIGFASAMAARRAGAVIGADQALLAAEGAEAMAAYVLRQSGATTGQDSLDQVWAQPYGPYELAPGVTLQFAQIDDEQGKFNINNLAPGGVTDQTSVQQFQRLLGELGLETKWAGMLADWIDSDNNPNDPDGAEDDAYLAQTPQYRAANEPVSSISEVMALPGFGRDRYNRLAPYITALPPGTPMNVCTASGVLLDALSGKTEYSTDMANLAASRQQGGCFPGLAVFNTSLSEQQQSLLVGRLAVHSSYFRLRTYITIGTARFSLYSLLYLDGGGQIRPILRTFGTE
ncbi:MAG TPA: type II secretion system minor pseudopilin GspK [Steroidobacteraceae bacterium]|nr:type II secretion system minor pseudopilin GspK [Steroidobacteraceae bacterium]